MKIRPRAELLHGGGRTDRRQAMTEPTVALRIFAKALQNENTVCPTLYRTLHFFNNSNTNEDIATKSEQQYVRCVRNEEECVCSPLQISLQYPH